MSRKTFLTTILVGLAAVSFVYLMLCLFYVRVPIIMPGCVFINGLTDMFFGNIIIELVKNIYFDINLISTLLFMLFTIFCIFTMKRTKVPLYISTAVYAAEMIYTLYLGIKIIVNYNAGLPLLFACAIWMMIDFIIVMAHMRYIKEFNFQNTAADKKVIADI